MLLYFIFALMCAIIVFKYSLKQGVNLMTKDEKIALLADVFEVDEEELREDLNLSELENWDSMTKLSLIVMMDDELEKQLTGDEIKSFNTVKDILDYMG
jgi:acyl carrier protein